MTVRANERSVTWLSSTASLSCLTLMLFPVVANAQVPAVVPATTPQAESVQDGDARSAGDIVVTASRRSESLSKLPFNVSAIDAGGLQRNNVTDVATLSRQLPNFIVQEGGERSSAQSVPIIRGLNASGTTGYAPRYFQSPVGLYLGNAPITGSIPLLDLERVEVLRGPQGTLYGAGALSGAVRYLPTLPTLDRMEGYVSGGLSKFDHSGGVGYDFTGAINVPLGQTLAIRVAGRHERKAGYVDAFDIIRREGDDYVAGLPVLETPGDLVNSKAQYFNKKDSNWSESTTVRSILNWKPSATFNAQLSYVFARSEGVGGPVDNHRYPGGTSPIDPRITLGATGDYERSQPMLEPYHRDSHLGSLDLSYDLGFATLSGTMAYGKTRGFNAGDVTAALLGVGYGAYYTGVPANPRAVIAVRNIDDERNVTEELRLVSAAGGPFDYTVGLFLQQQRRAIGLTLFDPGADTYSAAAHGGSTIPMAAGGTYVPLFAGGISNDQITKQKFREYSAYGDFTYHVTDRWQLTGGARLFHQTFNQYLRVDSSFFEVHEEATSDVSTTSAIFKANSSFKISDESQIYATWSQGFRRGGANAFPVTGPVLEPTELLNYKSDKTNNYEVGMKGRIGRIRYSVDAFYVDWSNPQIDLLTPYVQTYVVVNGSKAASKGAEFELSGPLGGGISFNLGGAYADATLTQEFHLPAGDGGGNVVPNAINGSKGDRLPSSPRFSGSGTINYDTVVGAGKLGFALGADYRSSTVSNLPSPPSYPDPFFRSSGYVLFRGNVSYELDGWEFLVYGNNLANRHVAYASNPRSSGSLSRLGAWGSNYIVSEPRQIGVRLTRRW